VRLWPRSPGGAIRAWSTRRGMPQLIQPGVGGLGLPAFVDGALLLVMSSLTCGCWPAGQHQPATMLRAWIEDGTADHSDERVARNPTRKTVTALKIQKVLEQAGIHFTDGGAGEMGARLQIDKNK
jgi:hypothetical protein